MFFKHLLLIFAVLYLQPAKGDTGDEDTVRMTVIVHQPLGGDRFSCFLSTPDTDASLQYGRYVKTRDNNYNINYYNREPSGTSTINSFPGSHRIRLNTSYKNTFGIFYCRAIKQGRLLTTVTATVLLQNAEIVPTDGLWTKTVNKGDQGVVLSMTGIVSSSNYFAWRFNNSGILRTSSADTYSFGRAITKEDAGVYECHYNNERLDARQGLIRLIVRGCPTGRWGPPSCNRVCDKCYNGGICNDQNGRCVCPAGFFGENCLGACGENKAGYKCEITCSSSAQSCIGQVFCLPDPMGCTCGTGFRDYDCSPGCPLGRYGANCLQECHCLQMSSCDRFTGQCTGGSNGCLVSWSGNNCQIPDVCENDYFGETCTEKCQCVDDQPCDRVTGQCVNNQCKPGFSLNTGSLNCQECSGGSYGLDCAETCHCNIYACDKVTGSCAGECFGNWATPDCVTGVKSVTNTKANSGQSSTFTCVVTGSTPPPQHRVRLYRPDDNQHFALVSSEVIDQDRFVTFNVQEVQSNEEYRCYIDQPFATLSYTADMFELPELTTVPRATDIQAFEVTITWDAWSSPPLSGDPPITHYTIYYREYLSEWQALPNDIPTTRTTETVRNLMPEMRYELSVTASREGPGGEGPRSPSVSVTTPCSVPLESPEIVSALGKDTTLRQITVQWEELKAVFHGCSTGLMGYHIRYRTVSKSSYGEYTEVGITSAISSFNISNLEPYTQYGISISASNEIGPGPWSEDVLAYTPEEAPLLPPKVTLIGSTEDSLTLRIEATKPYNLNGNISQYLIQYQQASDTGEGNIITVNNTEYNVTYIIQGLAGLTDFNIKVKIVNGAGDSEWSESVSAKTVNKGNRAANGGSVTGSILGVLVVLLVVVVVVFILWKRKQKSKSKERQQEKDQPALTLTEINDGPIYENTDKVPETSSSAKTDEEKIQVQLEIAKTPVVEKDFIPPKPKHKPIPPRTSDKQLLLQQSGTLQQEPDKVVGEVQPTGGEDGASCPVSSEQSVYGNLNIGPQLSIPIPVAKLENYIKQKKASSTDSLKYEYSILPVDQKKPWTVAEHPDLKTKNRFKNIIPYDHSRVPLVPIDGVPLSDYYNASYIKDYDHKTSFIAAMGPNASALNDFWRMIWQEQITLIVMVTKLVENGKDKCKQYWPSGKDQSEQFGDVVVNLEEQKSLSDYTIHTLKVHKVDGESECRIIKHFTMTTWPDMGVPLYPSAILNLIQVVKETRKIQVNHGAETPVLIHCSAGVGRTGTFIAIYTLLDMMTQRQQISVFGYVNEMRESRVNMVQTYDQYVFIYSALLEAYLCGDTQILARDYPETLSKLKRLNPKTRRTHLEDEFRILNQVTPKPDDAFTGGLLPENANKNRFPDILPLERHRPFLVTEGDTDDSNNYINAAFVDSFNRKDAFITTQIPLPHTVADIWRLAFDWNCPAIVSLDDPSSVYNKWDEMWPQSGVTRFGPLFVELISTNGGRVYKCQTYKVSRRDQKEKSIIVKHFQLLGWASNQDKPSSPQCILDLLGAVQRWKDECHSSRPAIVQCLNGVGRSGVFCAVSTVAEKITSDDAVDIFQAVKRLRMNRPLMVETLEQYILCYEVIQEHLQRFQEYGNLNY